MDLMEVDIDNIFTAWPNRSFLVRAVNGVQIADSTVSTQSLAMSVFDISTKGPMLVMEF